MRFLKIFASFYLLGLFCAVLIYTLNPWTNAIDSQVNSMLVRPNIENLFGTDSLGRDFLGRILMGGKNTLLISIGSSLILGVLGLIWGAVAAVGPRWLDVGLNRILDILVALPQLVSATILALVFEHFLRFDIYTRLILIVGCTHWFGLARLVYHRSKLELSEVYVEASRALGGGEFHILKRHILPSLMSLSATYMVTHLSQVILAESFISFLGLGVESPQTSWGLLLNEGWRFLTTDPHLIFFPSLVLFLTIWSLSILFQPTSKQVL